MNSLILNKGFSVVFCKAPDLDSSCLKTYLGQIHLRRGLTLA